VEKDDAHRDKAGIGKGPDRKAGREEGNFQWIVLSQVHVVGHRCSVYQQKKEKQTR
jgi:hypothetical protein